MQQQHKQGYLPLLDPRSSPQLLSGEIKSSLGAFLRLCLVPGVPAQGDAGLPIAILLPSSSLLHPPWYQGAQGSCTGTPQAESSEMPEEGAEGEREQLVPPAQVPATG